MASLWMLVASLFFASMGVCVKLGAASFSSAELVFYRGFIAAVLIGATIGVRRWSLRTPHVAAHFRRGLSGFVSLAMYFYAISRLPLPTAVTLNYTAPLFLAGMLAVTGREKVRPGLLLALVVGFVGIALLLRPTFAGEQWGAGLVGLASGVTAAMAYWNVRELGALGEPEWRTVFYFSLFSALGGLPWMVTGQTLHAVGGQGLLLLLGVGGFGALAQLAMTRAYKYGKTLVSASLAYSTVVFSSLYGILIWDDQLDAFSWLGVGLVVGSGLLASQSARSAPAEQD